MKGGTFLHTVCGSPLYTAPEILQSHNYIGPEVDVWSLGCLLYVMVTGCCPWNGNSLPEQVQNATKGKFEPFPGISNDCWNVIGRMLVVDPHKRATLAEIRTHSWVNKAYLGPPDTVVPTKREAPMKLDNEVLKQMSALGFEKDEVVKDILENKKVKQTFVLYYLMLDHKEKEAKIKKKNATFGEFTTDPRDEVKKGSHDNEDEPTSDSKDKDKENKDKDKDNKDKDKEREKDKEKEKEKDKEKEKEKEKDSQRPLSQSEPIVVEPESSGLFSRLKKTFGTGTKDVKKFPTNTDITATMRESGRERSKTVSEGIPEPTSMSSFRDYKEKRDRGKRESTIGELNNKPKLRVMKVQPSQDRSSEKSVEEIEKEIEKALSTFGVAFKKKGFKYSCKDFKVYDSLKIDIEICRFDEKDVEKKGIKFSRKAGSTWDYKDAVSNITRHLKL